LAIVSDRYAAGKGPFAAPTQDFRQPCINPTQNPTQHITVSRRRGSQPILSTHEKTLVSQGLAIIRETLQTREVGDEGLDRISYYSLKHEFLDQPSKQVVAQVVANPTLSETVALLIESWDDLCPEERTLLTALLSLNTSNVSQQR
jgi:hypothetical protein